MVYMVGVYKNIKHGSIILNAMAISEIGTATATDTIKMLQSPMESVELGNAFLELLNVCIERPYWIPEMGGNIHSLLGYSTYSKFVKEHLLVSAELDDDKKSLILNSTRHQGHGFVGNDFQITLTLLDETKKIGNSLMKALEKSK